MPRFFVRPEQIEEFNGKKRVIIKGDDAHHISRSLRMAAGETIEVCDMQKNVYQCVLESFNADCVCAAVEKKCESDTEPPCKIKLYQALPKSDKLEIIIQKSTECGVYSVVPFYSERCISRPKAKDIPTKLMRWNKISESAAKQCGRIIIPEIKEPVGYKEMLKEASKERLMIFCYEGSGTNSIKKVLHSFNGNIPKDISLIIGCEGGFSANEVEEALSCGAQTVSLGKRILRCETAAPFALACILYETEM